MERWLRRGSWVAGGIAAVLATTLFVTVLRSDEGTLHMVPAEYRFELPLGPGTENDTTLVIQNDTRRPVTLLGATETCELGVCSSLTGLPLVIGPGASHGLPVCVRTTEPGPFSHEIPIYTDAPGQPILNLRIVGVVVEPSETTAKPAASGSPAGADSP